MKTLQALTICLLLFISLTSQAQTYPEMISKAGDLLTMGNQWISNAADEPNYENEHENIKGSNNRISAYSYPLNIFSNTVAFSIEQNGITLSGTVQISAEFVFLGAPYLKRKYEQLTINSVRYKGELFNENSAYGSTSYADDYIKFPYQFSHGSNKIEVTFPLFVAHESGNDTYGYRCNINYSMNDYKFYHTTDVFGVADPSEVKEVMNYFRNNSPTELSDSDLWECSEIDVNRIEVNRLSQNIISEIQRKLDLAIENK